MLPLGSSRHRLQWNNWPDNDERMIHPFTPQTWHPQRAACRHHHLGGLVDQTELPLVKLVFLTRSTESFLMIRESPSVSKVLLKPTDWSPPPPAPPQKQ